METVTLSTKYQLVLPRQARERMKLTPGMRFTVIEKGGVLHLIPQRPLEDYEGILAGRGITSKNIRAKKDRL